MGTGTEFENVRVVFAGVQQRIRCQSPYSLPLQRRELFPLPKRNNLGTGPEFSVG